MSHLGNSAQPVYQGPSGTSRQEYSTVQKACKHSFSSWVSNTSDTFSPRTSDVGVANVLFGFVPGSLFTSSAAGGGLVWTLPTGVIMNEAYPNMQINDSFLFEVINLNAAQTITITAAASGHTVTGSGVCAAMSRTVFECNRTGGATFATFRLYSHVIVA